MEMEGFRTFAGYTGGIPTYRINTNIRPFSNLLEMVSYYHGVAQRMDPDELDCFIDNERAEKKDQFPALISADDMMHIIIATIFETQDNTSSAAWMDFDEKEMDALLDHDFFREYDMNVLRYEEYVPRIIPSGPNPRINICARKYGWLELYTYTKLQSIAASVLPENRSDEVWILWCSEDILPFLVKIGFYSAVAEVYKRFGKNWFCRSRYGDQYFNPIAYECCYKAILACRDTNAVARDQLRKDLLNLYSEYLMLYARSEPSKLNNETMEMLKDGLEHFDDVQISELRAELTLREHENEELRQDKESLQKTCDAFRAQIQCLQNDDWTDGEKISTMLDWIYRSMPDPVNFDKTKQQLADIWEQLSDSSRLAIRKSLGIFGLIGAADCAVFPLVCSVEQEFNLNFFEPFKRSKQYRAIKNPFCRSQKYETTHKALYSTKDHPTMGNIPFIGRAVKEKKGGEASDVIAAFAKFLGNEKEAFCRLCEAVDRYRVGLKKYRLVDLRNGLAHGDRAVEKDCDESCFNDVRSMLYEPPIQIMYGIVAHSKK